jgi:hypothetical protein
MDRSDEMGKPLRFPPQAGTLTSKFILGELSSTEAKFNCILNAGLRLLLFR